MQNWPEYEAGLRRRGSLTLWIEEHALDQWQSSGADGQARYGDIASDLFEAARDLQTGTSTNRRLDGFSADIDESGDLGAGSRRGQPPGSWIDNHAVRVCPKGPLHVLIDSTGIEASGAGQWLETKHGAKSRRTWRKLHLAVDADSGMIAAHVLTDQYTEDPSQVARLLDQIDEKISLAMADGAYYGAPLTRASRTMAKILR